VSAIVTSPPYNLGIRYRSYLDTLPRVEYLEWSGQWIAGARRVLKPELTSRTEEEPGRR